MIQLNPKVDLYIKDGCGRCALHATPKCKVNKWQIELETLRQIVLESGLTEELKWGVPVYTHMGKNILTVSALKDACIIGFFKGVLIKDTQNMLIKQGENSQSSRIVKFTSESEILNHQDTLIDFIHQAIQIEENGEKVEFKKDDISVPEELTQKFEVNPAFKTAFYELTPGRQKGYLLYFSQAKQSATRTQRINNYTQKIFEGIGFHDEYKMNNKKK